MLPVTVKNDVVHLGPSLSVSFKRTLRLPDNDRSYPLPPNMGSFPIRRVEDYADRVPASWRDHGGVFIPMYQREAMYINLHGSPSAPRALKVAVGKVNALSGKPWDQRLRRGAQDYVVSPTQPWLDGINSGDGQVKQFVAMPLGMGYTVEGQVTGEETHGGLQLIAYATKPSWRPVRYRRRFVGEPTWTSSSSTLSSTAVMSDVAMPSPLRGLRGAEMGVAAGGRMRQEIKADPHGIDTWDQENYGRVFVHIVNSEMWQQITGEPAPASPVSAQDYSAAGLPWYESYSEGRDVPASPVLGRVSSVAEMDAKHGFTNLQDDEHVATRTVPLLPHQVSDGRW